MFLYYDVHPLSLIVKIIYSIFILIAPLPGVHLGCRVGAHGCKKIVNEKNLNVIKRGHSFILFLD